MLAKTYDGNNMEKHSLGMKILRFFTVPILNSVPPSTLQRFVQKSSPYGAKVIAVAGTSHSLETMYNKEKVRTRSFWKGIADNFWHNVISQPKAIRNRLRITEDILGREVSELVKTGNDVRIYTLGGGSSRAIIQVLSRLKPEQLSKFQVTTIDKSEKALELGKSLARQFNVSEQFTWMQGDVRDIGTLLPDNSADFIEMVGLLDYFDFEASVRLVFQIHQKLKSSGVFLVANVHPNSESEFVKNVGWPHMHYKTAEDLYGILSKAGFREEYLELIFEPLKVHLVGVARKK